MATKAKKYRVKATADAPDFVSHGNLEADKKSGYYETTDERFAAHLHDNYGVGVKTDEAVEDEPASEAADNTEDVNNG